jgi:O-antigen/teichoic acid export membrane protein/SAM-dependent methyltransferase
LIRRAQHVLEPPLIGSWNRALGIARRLAGSDFVQKVAETYLTRILGILVSLATSVIVARQLGPEGRGRFAIAVAVGAIGVQFGNLGLGTSNTFFVARDRSLLGALLGNSLAVAFGLGTLAALAAYALFQLWPGLAPVAGALLLMALLSVPLGLANLLLQNLVLGLQQVRTYNVIEAATRALSIALIVALVLARLISPGSLLALNLVLLVVSSLWCAHALGAARTARPALSGTLLLESLAYSVKVYLASFFAFMILRSDLLLVQHMLGNEQAGYYSIAAGLADMLYILPSIVGTILFPRLSATTDNLARWALTRRAAAGTLALFFPLVIVATLLAKPIIGTLYGRAFLPAALPAQILCVAMLFYGINNVFAALISAMGLPWLSVHFWWIGLALNVALNLALIPLWGTTGAAVASLVGYGLVMVLNLVYAARKCGAIQVVRDFDRVYAQEQDPWGIGEAELARYDRYRELLDRHKRSSDTLLDVGCGQGAVLNRFRGGFRELVGAEISQTAIERGRARFPQIAFRQGSADRLDEAFAAGEAFDAILYSDVICYLDEEGKRRSLAWIHDHLRQGGVALVAAWCPGGQYLEPAELRRLLRRQFRIAHEETLPSQHAIFVVEPRRRGVAITVDYETWHPVPAGRTIDWQADVFDPANELLAIADDEGVKLTFMAELGEYLWLRDNQPHTADAMAGQWRDAIRRGHDVQLHLHPNWLPSLGARLENGQWHWDWSKAKADDYPGDLDDLIRTCVQTLEALLRPERDDYRVTCFRAGAYQAQPFQRLYAALVANRILCDSSVYAGGVSDERGYDYTFAYSGHNPYFASPLDPQLKAVPAEAGLVELPVFTPRPGQRWFLDGNEGPQIAGRLLRYLEEQADRRTTESARRRRALKGWLASLYSRLKPFHRTLNRLLPANAAAWLTEYAREELAGHDYFVMIGHTKGDHDFDAIRTNLRRLRGDARFDFLPLTELAARARDDLQRTLRSSGTEEADYQVQREFNAVMGEERNEAQSFRLQEMIRWDCDRLLDLGCGSGYWSERIGRLYPWMKVVGVDFGQAFIEKAQERYRLPNLEFQREDFLALSFPDSSFDVVYADNTIEHSFDVRRTLSEAFRVLRPGGTLVAALPPDGVNPERTCDNHTWKTIPREARLRLAHAGFVDISIHELDTYRELGMPPYPPSDNRMMYIRAWKRHQPATTLDRAREAMDWLYRRLAPGEGASAMEPEPILAGGRALCIGYVIALGELLRREGMDVSWLTMLAEDHPRGRGPRAEDSHEVVVLRADGAEVLLDPTTNTCIPYSLEAVMRVPSLAAPKTAADSRYRERDYHLYDTAFWYSRIARYAIRRDHREPPVHWVNNPHRRPQ